MRRLPAASFAIVAILALASCERGTTTAGQLESPNLVLVSIDTLRADRLGCYGYFRDTSPEIDGLAGESLVFENCHAVMATTFPSHLSLMTSTFPEENGAVANVGAGGDAFVAGGPMRTLAETLRSQGYDTAAFVSGVSVKKYTGISAGFDSFDEPSGRERRAEDTNRMALRWLDRAGKRPFFLWVHYFDPHDPYMPPPPFDTEYSQDDGLRRYLIERRFRDKSGGLVPVPYRQDMRLANSLYDGEVAYTDSQVGKLLARLRSRREMWDKTVVVLVADHGEGLGQHGEMYHGSIWQEQLRVPVIMRVPGLSPRRIDRLMSLADVVPTLMGLIKLPGEQDFLRQASGVDRLDEDMAGEPVCSLESAAPWKKRPGDPGPRYVLTDPQWTLIHDAGGPDLLFKRDSDPYQLHDRHGDFPDIAERLRRQLLARIEAQKNKRSALHRGDALPLPKVDETTIEHLRLLGYLK